MLTQNRTKLILLILITCLMSVSSTTLIAKPHEELTFEPIEFNPPVPEKRVLSNGMTLYLLEDHELPVFNISGLVKTGTIYDTKDKIGLASICASVMRTGGTETREPDALNEQLESMAASVEIGMSPEYGSVNLSTMAEDIQKGLEIFADVLGNPAFREEKLQLRKQQAIEAIRRRNDNPIQLAWRNFSEILYGKDHPFGWYSEIDGVESITVDDLKAFHTKFFKPENIMLAITGDFDTDTLINQLEKVFEGWENTKTDFPAIEPVENMPKPSVNHIQKDLPQTTMLIGHYGIKRTPDFPDFFALRVMNDILGEGGFTSRLMMEVREKHGLAYMVGSLMQTSFYTNPGEWFAYCQTRSEKTSEAIALIISLIKDIRENPVTEEELNRTKDSLINSFVFGFESSSQIAFQQMMLAYRGFAPDFLETFTDHIAKVTAEDVQTVAQKYLHPDALTIVTVGNQDNFDRPLTEFGEVNEIEIKQPEPPPTEPIPEANETDIAKAKEIIAATIQAYGGLEKLKAVKNVVTNQIVTFKTLSGPFNMNVEITQIYPDKFRQDMNNPQGKVSIVFDGETTVFFSPNGMQPVPPETTAELKDAVFRDTVPLLIHLSQNDTVVQYTGTEDVNNEKSSVLLVKQPSGEMLKLFISEETHLVVKTAYRQTRQGMTENLETIYSDYREIEGVMFPFSYVQYIDEEQHTQNNVSALKVNTDIDDSLFDTSE